MDEVSKVYWHYWAGWHVLRTSKHFANAIFPVENENVFIYLIPKAYVFRTDEASKVYWHDWAGWKPFTVQCTY